MVLESVCCLSGQIQLSNIFITAHAKEIEEPRPFKEVNVELILAFERGENVFPETEIAIRVADAEQIDVCERIRCPVPVLHDLYQFDHPPLETGSEDVYFKVGSQKS